MNYSVLEKSALFQGFKEKEIKYILDKTPHHTKRFQKDEIIFHQLANADQVGIILQGQVQAQKTFPNGSMVNVSTRKEGELVGPAATFAKNHRYPCDVIALTDARLMMFTRKEMLSLLQTDLRILENFTTQISTMTSLLQQRLELFSYSGIAEKAAFWLLLRHQQSGKNMISLPESMTKWANTMNVSRPSLHREIKKMEAKGLIHYEKNRIHLLDVEGLESLLSQ